MNSLSSLICGLGLLFAVDGLAADLASASSSVATGSEQKALVDNALDYVAAVDVSIEAVTGMKQWDPGFADKLDKQFQSLLVAGQQFTSTTAHKPLDQCLGMAEAAEAWWQAKREVIQAQAVAGKRVTAAADGYTAARKACMAQINH